MFINIGGLEVENSGLIFDWTVFEAVGWRLQAVVKSSTSLTLKECRNPYGYKKCVDECHVGLVVVFLWSTALLEMIWGIVLSFQENCNELELFLITVLKLYSACDEERMLLEAFAVQLDWEDTTPWFRRFLDSLWESESNWDASCDFWDIYLDSRRCFVHPRSLWNLSTALEYVEYFGIVRTMPTYTRWPLGIWSVTFIYMYDLVLTFSYCSERITLALWLPMTGY